MEETREKRPAEFSKTEWMKRLHYEDINGAGRLFGGRLMQWMDEVAGICATRHASAQVTTAACDNLQFKKGAFIDQTIVIVAKVTYVGKTSIEVRTDVYVEDVKTGMRHTINRAYFTEVCIDEEGRPAPVKYGLLLMTESEKAEYEAALRRLEIRKQRRTEGF